MGGIGSGNREPRWNKKGVVEDCLCLNANVWMRAGILKAGVRKTGFWGWTYSDGSQSDVRYEVCTYDLSRPGLRLRYSRKPNGAGPPEEADYLVPLTTTRQWNGGVRWWFRCPLRVGGRPCNRRVAKLYLPRRGRHFGCRRCHNLTYRSCQENHKQDAFDRLMPRHSGLEFAHVKPPMD
jgi:hypothetical protein